VSVGAVRLGLRENLAQFSLLVAINAFVGAMVGLERSTLPLIGEQDFGLGSSAAVLSFIVAFGLAKAFTNLGAGAFAQRLGRRRLLILGWALALPVPLLIAVAPSWGWVVAANALLGVNQGLAWSMTVVMKIDLVGPKRRGLALGLNEAAGYGGVALAAVVSGWLASEYAARDVLVAGGAVVAVVALLLSVLFVRDTAEHVAREQASAAHPEDGPPPPRRALPRRRSVTPRSGRARRRVSRTTSTTPSPGASCRSSSPPMGLPPPRSGWSPVYTRPSGGRLRSGQATGPTASAASR
jgi:predicted MFS family arabinose efflux permease